MKEAEAKQAFEESLLKLKEIEDKVREVEEAQKRPSILAAKAAAAAAAEAAAAAPPPAKGKPPAKPAGRPLVH